MESGKFVPPEAASNFTPNPNTHEDTIAESEGTGRSYKPLGEIQVPELGRYEFLIPADVTDPDGLDLIVKDEDGEEISVIRALLDYDDSSQSYRVTFKPNSSAMKLFSDHGNIDGIINSYVQEAESNQNIYISKRREQTNNHIIRASQFVDNGNQQDFEYLHQQRSGDCVLATTLDIISFNGDGHLPLTTAQTREIAIQLRRSRGEDTTDIDSPDSPLSYSDFIYLLSELTGRPPKQSNIITIEGQNRPNNEVGIEIMELLDKLAESDYKTMAVGTSYHARALKDLGGDGHYALIDPLVSGVTKMTVEETLHFLTRECAGRQNNDNFFYIV